MTWAMEDRVKPTYPNHGYVQSQLTELHQPNQFMGWWCSVDCDLPYPGLAS
jgi:hypothetical protein